eukprot:CAMPEP_0178439432 /NCGR_PEP_ID=MMETSP0689_2-20121128/36152_1 /TAXON_ID=160604 /ORGANISM="Amphidinium massartii, Strain CS-259" /LENGTH=286 /DNA_ID=CAMNT_0020061959 /DNA_START=42 /DNA_END=898 /DNA_ORIENTATION=-
MAGDGSFHTEFMLWWEFMEDSTVSPFVEMLAELHTLRGEEPPTFLEAMQEIEAWIAMSQKKRHIASLEEFQRQKLLCWEQADQLVKSGASSLPVDIVAALKMHCTGKDQALCCRFMLAASEPDLSLGSNPDYSLAGGLTGARQVLPSFKPYLWQLQSALKALPVYSDDHSVYCQAPLSSPEPGEEIVVLTPTAATPSLEAVLGAKRRCRHICKIKLSQFQARNISQYCDFPPGVTETAVLLPPGSTFRCESVTDMENHRKCCNLIELPSQHWISDLASSDQIDRRR